MSKKRLCESCGQGGVRSGRRFCSIACARPSAVKQACINCSALTTNSKFCSYSCYTTHRAPDQYERECAWCKNTFKARVSDTKTTCSVSCASYVRWQDKSNPVYSHTARQNALNVYDRVPSVQEVKKYLWNVQEQKCALCSEHIESANIGHLDHDHDTEAIRGLLHPTCNSGLGFLGDSLDNLYRAVTYLENCSG